MTIVIAILLMSVAFVVVLGLLPIKSSEMGLVYRKVLIHIIVVEAATVQAKYKIIHC